MTSTRLSVNAYRPMALHQKMPRFATIGAFFVLCFVLCLAFANRAEASICSGALTAPTPTWVINFGQNTNAQSIFGYAQTRPDKNQTLADVTQILKTQALSDLALNIQANVTSEISADLTFDGNNERSSTRINNNAQSNLSFVSVTETITYVNEQSCRVYARVSLLRKDIPYVLALNGFVTTAKVLQNKKATRQTIAGLEDVIAALQQSSKEGSAATRQHFASLSGKLDAVRQTANAQSLELHKALMTSQDAPPSARLASATQLIEALSKNTDATSSDAGLLADAKALRAKLNAIIGGKLTAVAWSTSNRSVSAGLSTLFEARKENFWLAGTGTTLAALMTQASAYQLKTALFVDITRQINRRFGIDEVDITIKLNYLAVPSGDITQSKTFITKAIGRPINDKAIADKIVAVLQPAL